MSKIPSQFIHSANAKQGGDTVDLTTARDNVEFIISHNGRRDIKNNGNRSSVAATGNYQICAVPKLNEGVQSPTNSTLYTFFFGVGDAENGFYDSIVTIDFNSDPASTAQNFNETNIILDFVGQDYNLTKGTNFNVVNGVKIHHFSNQNFLRIASDSNNPAKISIDNILVPKSGGTTSVAEANCQVVIMNNQSTHTLAVLDPVQKNSFVVNEQVWIIPFIIPSVSTSNGVTTIDFEVGDPVSNGKITIR